MIDCAAANPGYGRFDRRKQDRGVGKPVANPITSAAVANYG
jgi:hypothetical protein